MTFLLESWVLCVCPSAEGAQSNDSSSNESKSAQVNKTPSSYKPHIIISTYNRDFAKKEEMKESPLELHSLELHTQRWVCRLLYFSVICTYSNINTHATNDHSVTYSLNRTEG